MTSSAPPFVRTLAALAIAVAPLHARGQLAAPQDLSSTGEVATFCDHPTRIVQVQRLTSSTEVVGIGPAGQRWQHSLPPAPTGTALVHASIGGDAIVLRTAAAKGEAFLVTGERASPIQRGYPVAVDFANGHTMVAMRDERDRQEARWDTRVRIYDNRSGAIASEHVVADADSYDTWTLERDWLFRLGHDGRHFYYIREGKDLVVVEVASGARKSLPLREAGGGALKQQVYDAVLVSPDTAFVATGAGGGLYLLGQGGLKRMPVPEAVGIVERLSYSPARQEIGVVGQTGWAVMSRHGANWSPGESGTGLVRLTPDAQGWVVREPGSETPVRYFSAANGKYRVTREVTGLARSATVACANGFGALVAEDGRLVWRAAR